MALTTIDSLITGTGTLVGRAIRAADDLTIAATGSVVSASDEAIFLSETLHQVIVEGSSNAARP